MKKNTKKTTAVEAPKTTSKPEATPKPQGTVLTPELLLEVFRVRAETTPGLTLFL